MDILRSRVQYFINEKLRITNREFEKALGLSNGMIARFLQGTNVGVDMILKIKEVYPDIDINWFFDESDNTITVQEPAVAYENHSENQSKVVEMLSQIVETNRILANSNLNLSDSNKILASSNEKLVNKVLE